MLMGSYGKPPTSNEKKKIPVPERYRKRRLAKLERMKQKEIEQARRSALQLNSALKNEKTKLIPIRKLRRIARN